MTEFWNWTRFPEKYIPKIFLLIYTYFKMFCPASHDLIKTALWLTFGLQSTSWGTLLYVQFNRPMFWVHVSQCGWVLTYQQQTGWGLGEPPTPRSDHGPCERSAPRFFWTYPTPGCSCPQSWTGWAPAVGGRRRRTHCCSGRGRCPAPMPWILLGHNHNDFKYLFWLFNARPGYWYFRKAEVQPGHWETWTYIEKQQLVTRVRALTIHSPDLDLPVVSSRHDEGHARVEGGPVDPAVMTLDTEGQAIDTNE